MGSAAVLQVVIMEICERLKCATHILGTRKKLAPKKANDAHMTLTKSSFVTPMAPPRRTRAVSSDVAGVAGFGVRSAGAGAATILDEESCEAVAEATITAKAIFFSMGF